MFPLRKKRIFSNSTLKIQKYKELSVALVISEYKQFFIDRKNTNCIFKLKSRDKC